MKGGGDRTVGRPWVLGLGPALVPLACGFALLALAAAGVWRKRAEGLESPAAGIGTRPPTEAPPTRV
jgi:hypothetical protein